MTPRVVIADASAPTRAGLRLALERGGLSVCANAADARELVAAATREAPDLVVLPIDLPGDALAATDTLARAVPGARIVVLTAQQDDDELVAAVLAGASGYLDKDVSAERLPHIMLAVLAGEAAIPRRLSGRLVAEVRARHRRGRALAGVTHVALSEREWDVAEHLEEGRGTADIARRLRISEVTVRRHISSIVAKLGVPDRRSAVALIRQRAQRRAAGS